MPISLCASSRAVRSRNWPPLERDRSTANRSLSTVSDCGFVRRDRRLLDGGGYVYQYTAVALPKTKAMLYEALDAWTTTVHDAIDEFDGTIE